MKRYLPFIIVAALFFLLKATNLTIRLSDSNVYFYTAYQIAQGKILYKDIFFTNFPLFPYISVLYYFLTFKQLSLYYLTPAIEAIATGFFLYKISLDKYKHLFFATLTILVYFLSFMLLATSDHQTGVFLASLFGISGYYCLQKKNYLFSGILFACMLMTKAYFLPVLLAAVGTIFFNLKQTSGNNTVIPAKAGIRSPIKSGMTKITTRTEIKFSIGCIIVFIIILLPSLIFAPHDIFRDIITYSLSRPQGLSKTNIAWFFIMHDLLLATGGIYAIVTLRRNRMYGLVCLLTIFLFIFYQDFYYLYFNVALPYLCLSFIGLYHFLNKRFSFTHAIGMTVLIPFFLFSFFVYMKTYHHIQQIPNTDQVVSAIKQRHPSYIYGTESIVTAFAYLSHTPLLDNVIDTNDTLFRKGFLDKSKLTADAIRTKALIVTEGVMISEQGVTADILGDAFDVPQIVKHCHNVLRIPVTTEGYINRINLFSC